MNTKEKLKNVIPIFLFNILLPTADIVTDLELIIKLFLGNKYGVVGTALLIPFTLNYIFTMACWMRSKEKIQTIIFPVLNIYPQFCEYTLNIFLLSSSLYLSISKSFVISER